MTDLAMAYFAGRLARVLHADTVLVLDDDLPEEERVAGDRVTVDARMTFAAYVHANWACVAEVGNAAQRADFAFRVFLPMLDRYAAEVHGYHGRWTRSAVTLREAGYKHDFRCAVVTYVDSHAPDWARELLQRFTCI
jgi:hypothetical protein